MLNKWLRNGGKESGTFGEIHCDMVHRIARPLDSQQEVDRFLSEALGLDLRRLKDDITARIIVCEKGVMDGAEFPTSVSAKFRMSPYKTDEERLRLRARIVGELSRFKRLENDNKIRLGKGGAMPLQTLARKQAFILIGLPASGKSSIAIDIADKYGALLLDSDLAKRKLPEYKVYPWGASLVNDESTLIMFGNKVKDGFLSLCEHATSNDYNIVVPKIGATPGSLITLCQGLKTMRYKVHLTLVNVPRQKAAQRALQRYIHSNRYVPLAMIFDEYANDPALTYFKLKMLRPGYIDTYGIINTDVPFGVPCYCVDVEGNNPARLFKRGKNSLI